MIRIISTTILIVLLAVLVAFNLRYTTSISIYGVEFTGVPVMVIALLSFALGVVYSLFLYVGRYLRRRNLQDRQRDVARREQALSARETPDGTGGGPAPEPPAQTPTPPPQPRGLFGRKRRSE